ncbi:hypothetical protein HU200_009494 [Digitaria exilis]|uniref:Endonuclease/exonuclease/phosphatase domain-containing protein n=1 Tax=Digitaria exilis TaxID=1010633 RepID=A0A835FK38_9POAL|nr:hypothetical protein HU200_009494 [Digitaria exilis]
MFLPSRLTCFATRPSDGAAGGILTAWDARVFSLCSTDEREFSLTVVLTLLSDGASLTITNVYAPTARSEKTSFLAELETIAAMTSGPWMIIGDFNLTRLPTDKNKGPFNHSEAHLFNDTINTIALLEIPLVDRAFTWSNKRDNPTLVRLDQQRQITFLSCSAPQPPPLNARLQKGLSLLGTAEHDTKALLDALDRLEELRSLTRPEATLRRLACEGLRSPPITEWTFDLGDLYPNFCVAADELSAPFCSDEISEALFAMDMNASPGPDVELD